jgi:dinuclear metal center YbgI/SA1388 family protein
MPTVADVAEFFQRYTPLRLAEDWDNVGLLVGDAAAEVHRLMTCLTITAASAAEAVRERAELIVTHHPLPFRPLKRVTCETPEGRMLWDLIGSRVAVFSPHTAFDSAAEGINQRLAEGLELAEIEPLRPLLESIAGAEGASAPLGAGRQGRWDEPTTMAELAERLKRLLKIDLVQFVGEPNRLLHRIGVACGSAGEFLPIAAEQGCDCLVTGETRFHTCLEAEARGIALVLVGHYASERFGVEALAGVLAQRFPDITAWASRDERDPLRRL